MRVYIMVDALARNLKPHTTHSDVKARLVLGPSALVGQDHGLAHAVDDECNQLLPFGQLDAL